MTSTTPTPAPPPSIFVAVTIRDGIIEQGVTSDPRVRVAIIDIDTNAEADYVHRFEDTWAGFHFAEDDACDADEAARLHALALACAVSPSREAIEQENEA